MISPAFSTAPGRFRWYTQPDSVSDVADPIHRQQQASITHSVKVNTLTVIIEDQEVLSGARPSHLHVVFGALRDEVDFHYCVEGLEGQYLASVGVRKGEGVVEVVVSVLYGVVSNEGGSTGHSQHCVWLLPLHLSSNEVVQPSSVYREEGQLYMMLAEGVLVSRRSVQ
ncbi:hypothetical protein E2C01_000072 [Portunus trituberculatus]|uniref:Uncharacterized protein n=1 Tax=Portunus trituberculatus TaxID=210409 RepID=A0A5B7CFJ4_PORTR|nr:hypothetical protein [Portunus trituberculatus]